MLNRCKIYHVHTLSSGINMLTFAYYTQRTAQLNLLEIGNSAIKLNIYAYSKLLNTIKSQNTKQYKCRKLSVCAVFLNSFFLHQHTGALYLSGIVYAWQYVYEEMMMIMK